MFIKECVGDLCHLPGVHPLAMFWGGCLICDRGLSMTYQEGTGECLKGHISYQVKMQR